MPFGLPPTAPKPQLSGVRPHLTPNSAVQKPQALANTARAFSPMLKTARQTLTQLPGPMQALGGLSLEGIGIEGVERLAMARGNGSNKPNRTEQGKKNLRDAVARTNAERARLRTELKLPYYKYKDPAKRKQWTLSELRQMKKQQVSSSHRPPASSSSHRPPASSSSHRPPASSSSHRPPASSNQPQRPTNPFVVFGRDAALDAFDRHQEEDRLRHR